MFCVNLMKLSLYITYHFPHLQCETGSIAEVMSACRSLMQLGVLDNVTSLLKLVYPRLTFDTTN